MKIPYDFEYVNCHKRHRIYADLNADKMSLDCECGQQHPHLPTDYIVGRKILRRAKFEYDEAKDFPMSIVFSATAFECELADLHHRKHTVDALNSTRSYPSNEELEQKLRKYPAIDKRVNHVAQLFGYRDIDEFVQKSSDLTKVVQNGFPSIRLGHVAEDFQKNLFWLRNRVLHIGFTNYSEQDALKCQPKIFEILKNFFIGVSGIGPDRF